jgi:hypothetical protein
MDLPGALRTPLFFWTIWNEAGSPVTNDPDWGQNHTFDDMGIFVRALKRYVEMSFDALDEEQRNAVYGHVYQLAGNEREVDQTRFTRERWGEENATANVLRLIDALMRLRA